MSRPIKVLQLQNRYNVNASDLAEQIIQGLPPGQYEVTAAFLRGRPAAGEPESRAARSVYFEFDKTATKGLRLRPLLALYRHCRDEHYDAVIAHRFKPINMLMLLNRWLHVPACIGVLHGLGEYDRAYRRWTMRALSSPAWRMVGVSRAVRDELLHCGAGFTAANVRQINNAIDIDRAEGMQHARALARERLGLDAGRFILGTIGRLVPVKGQVDLLEAFALIRHDHPQAMVAIIGEGRSRADLEAVIARHDMHDQVRLLGAKDDALQYVRAFDVFVLPSLSEGLPLALLEAMSGRVPVAGSDIDSLRPILEDCGGRVFPVRNAKALSACLEEILALPPAQLSAEGERAYAYLRAAHAIETFRLQYRSLLDELLRAAGRHG